jgi:aryl-alcohol dehydrogenase-like predicted oxidoreductase
MRYRTLGDLKVSAVGLGAMPLSIEGRPDAERALATVRAALDAGVTLFDTADSYHLPGAEPGHNERLVARALAGADVLIATKGGRGRPADGSWTVNGDPRHLKRAAEASLRRLGVEAIGLYQLHKPDPAVPFEESVGALRELLDEGKIRLAGVSNTDVGQIRAAHRILGDRLVSVQNRYSPQVRDSEPELRLCAELGLAFLPWSPLGGLSRSSLDGPSGLPGSARFGIFHEIAAERRVSPQQVGLAWLLAKSPAVIPIPGASRPETIRDSAGAAELVLSGVELARLDAVWNEGGGPGGREGLEGGGPKGGGS